MHKPDNDRSWLIGQKGDARRVHMQIYINGMRERVDMGSTSHYSYYYNTMDFRRTNASILLGVVVLIVVLLLC